jgi:tetratricopeptide (TPR) repeat protein
MPGKRKDRLDTNVVLHQTIIEGYGTVNAFCSAFGLHAPYLGELINLKRSPLGGFGKWQEFCVNVSEILNIPVEELFPLELYKEVITADKRTIEEPFCSLSSSDWQQLGDLPYVEAEIERAEAELLTAIEQSLSCLSIRDETIFRLRFGLTNEQIAYSYDEIGDYFELEGERIRQVVEEAIEIFKRAGQLNKIQKKYLDETWTHLQRLKNRRLFP